MIVSVDGMTPNHFPRKRARDTQAWASPLSERMALLINAIGTMHRMPPESSSTSQPEAKP
jgi:hypothetical protein